MVLPAYTLETALRVPSPDPVEDEDYYLTVLQHNSMKDVIVVNTASTDDTHITLFLYDTVTGKRTLERPFKVDNPNDFHKYIPALITMESRKPSEISKVVKKGLDKPLDKLPKKQIPVPPVVPVNPNRGDLPPQPVQP